MGYGSEVGELDAFFGQLLQIFVFYGGDVALIFQNNDQNSVEMPG